MQPSTRFNVLVSLSTGVCCPRSMRSHHDQPSLATNPESSVADCSLHRLHQSRRQRPCPLGNGPSSLSTATATHPDPFTSFIFRGVVGGQCQAGVLSARHSWKHSVTSLACGLAVGVGFIDAVYGLDTKLSRLGRGGERRRAKD